MPSTSPLLLYEGRFTDETHAKFNAAFAVSVAHAYPDHAILFRGQPNHIREVEIILAQVKATMPQPIRWQRYQPKRGTRIGIKGFTLPTALAVLDFINVIRKDTPRFVVILAAPAPFIFLYKRLANLVSLPPTLILQHGELGQMLESEPGTIEYQSLMHSNTPNIGNVVLGQSILDTLTKEFPAFSQTCFSLTHPWLWSSTHSPRKKNLTYPITLGLLGSAASHTGIEMFLSIVQHYKNTKTLVFQTTGALKHLDSPLPHELEQILPLSRKTIPHHEYLERVLTVDYGIGLWPLHRNRYAASGSFMDALDYGKPGIYLASPVIADAFTKMGDIGYLCQSQEEIIEILDTIQNDLPTERYQFQQKTIMAKRDIYSAYHLQDEYRTTIDRFLAQAA